MSGWKLGYETNCWGALGGDGVGVTSIKDLFYRTFADMGNALADIGEAGFQGVELFDGSLVDFADDIAGFRSLLDKAGVSLIGVYSGGNYIYPDILEDELWRVERAAQVAAAAGAEHLVVGGGAKRSNGLHDGDHERLARALDRVCHIAERHGLTAHFHPHLTTIAEAPDEIDEVFSMSRINFCPDTAHLAAGGGDPAAMIRKYFDRISYVHLKDLRRDPFAFLPLGEGELDMTGIVGTLADLGYSGWVTVELDSHPDPKAAALASRRFLEAAMRQHGMETVG
ncbi:MAG: sugar phosphate isomerase/epimerase [Alphaproteobacteria bacterium]